MKMPGERSADYLQTAQDAWAFLAEHNTQLTNDGRENIVDDYCALMAATELVPRDRRTRNIVRRPIDARSRSSGGSPPGRVTTGERTTRTGPSSTPPMPGLPVVSLLTYLEIADEAPKRRCSPRSGRRWSGSCAVTGEVPNPFGYARQLVQTKTGARDTRFFYPHDADTAPWWQGEDARLASLAFAARLAARHFSGDHAFAATLQRYAPTSSNWILGLNPFDASTPPGHGPQQPARTASSAPPSTPTRPAESSTASRRASAADGIDFNLPHTVTGADNDWRWGEQWLPHATWYLLARRPACRDRRPTAATEAASSSRTSSRRPPSSTRRRSTADQLTHINYAFANIRNGVVVEGFENDAKNFAALTSLRREHPHLKILVSVGGWTWSGGFSDAALSQRAARGSCRARWTSCAGTISMASTWTGNIPAMPAWATLPAGGQAELHGVDARAESGPRRRRARAAPHAICSRSRPARRRRSSRTPRWRRCRRSVDYVNLMTYDFREAGGGPRPATTRTSSTTRPTIASARPIARCRSSSPRACRRRSSSSACPSTGAPGATSRRQANGLYQSGTKPAERIETGYGKLAASLVDKDGFTRYWDDQAQAPYLWNPDRRSSSATRTRSRCASRRATCAIAVSPARCSGSTTTTRAAISSTRSSARCTRRSDRRDLSPALLLTGRDTWPS